MREEYGEEEEREGEREREMRREGGGEREREERARERERERRRQREDLSRSILATLPLWHSLCRELDCKIENTGLRCKWCCKSLFKMKYLFWVGLYIIYNLPKLPIMRSFIIC